MPTCRLRLVHGPALRLPTADRLLLTADPPYLDLAVVSCLGRRPTPSSVFTITTSAARPIAANPHASGRPRPGPTCSTSATTSPPSPTSSTPGQPSACSLTVLFRPHQGRSLLTLTAVLFPPGILFQSNSISIIKLFNTNFCKPMFPSQFWEPIFLNNMQLALISKRAVSFSLPLPRHTLPPLFLLLLFPQFLLPCFLPFLPSLAIFLRSLSLFLPPGPLPNTLPSTTSTPLARRYPLVRVACPLPS